MKTKLVISGAGGRMGKLVAALAIESKEFEIVAGIDREDNPDRGKDIGLLAGSEPINVMLGDKYPEKAGVVIDFSQPAGAEKAIDYCIQTNTALVMCTTGLSEDQVKRIHKLSEKTAVMYASNMSMGMNLLFSYAGKIAKALGSDFDIEIIEQHHRFKKDAPSGTALTLAENICKDTGREFPGCVVHGREGKEELRKKGDIGMHAVRGGDIVGEHEVIFAALGETIKISHSAHSRDIFARGAVRAASWIIGKEPKLYSMADCLGL